MMCTPRDDPMDLGPFLQEYVLRNPFENLPNGVPPGLGTEKQKGTKSIVKRSPQDPPAKKISPRPKLTPVQMSPPIILPTPPAPPTGPISPVLSPGGEMVPGTGSGIKTEPEDDGIKQENEEEDNEPDFGNENSVESETDSSLVDTPKAHIGSNLTYAVALRELRLPPKHYKVKKWLTQNYKHVPTHPDWLGSDILLKHIKTTFLDMKSSVLSRIMKFTFPECKKVINKYGYFYAGLLPKPDNTDLKNLPLMHAAALVQDGHITMARAAQQFGCTINQIGAILAWSKLKKLTEEEIALIDKEREVRKKNPCSTVSNKLRFQLRLNAQGRQSLTSQEKSDTTTMTPTPKNKRKAQSDPSYNPAGVKQRIVSSEGKGLATSRNRRKRGRPPPKFRESYTSFDSTPPYDDEEDNVTPENEGDTGEVGLGTVTVKEEPADTGYDKAFGADSTGVNLSSPADAADSMTSVRNSLSPTNKSSAPKSNISGVKEVGKSVKERKTCGRSSPVCNSSTAGQTINSVVDLLSIRRELSETCVKLTEAQTQNLELEVKLQDAHKVIAELRESLSTRESQITNLTNSFFDLSNQFMRASHEFKRVMQSIQPTGVKYDLPLS